MAESPICSVIRRLDKLLSSESRISQPTSKQLEQVQSKFENLLAIARIADARQEKDDRIHDWVTRTRETAYEAEDLLDNYFHDFLKKEKDLFRRPSEKKLKTLLDIESNVISREKEWQACNPGLISLEDDFVGLDEDVEKLVSKVVKEDGDGCFHVVSVVGISGIGKSALARKIYLHSDVRSHFEAFSWAYISRQWD